MTTITQNERRNTDSKRKRVVDQSLFGLFPIGKSQEGPLGPGFDRPFFEKSREYFLLTSALWKSSRVDAAIATAELPIRFGVIKRVQRPMISLSAVVSGGHFDFSLSSAQVAAA